MTKAKIKRRIKYLFSKEDILKGLREAKFSKYEALHYFAMIEDAKVLKEGKGEE